MAINYFQQLGFDRLGQNTLDTAKGLQGIRYNEQVMDIKNQEAKRQQKADQDKMLQFQNEQQRARAAQGAGAFYNALNSGNTQAALQIAQQYQDDINTLGDPTFTVDNIAEMMKRPEGVEQLKQMALGTAQLAAGPEQFARFSAEQAKAVKPEKPLPFQQGAGKLAGYVFNPNTGEYKFSTTVEEKMLGTPPDADIKDIQSLNKDVTGMIKEADSIRKTSTDITKLKQMGGGPASISIVYKFMKALDPGSVVREGEFATAENAGGIPDAVRNTYNKLINGERLSPEVLADFERTAIELANNAISSSAQTVDSYLNTYQDRLPPALKKDLRSRVPAMLTMPERIGSVPAINAQPVQPATNQQTIGGYKIIEVR